jgi:hypothetical protein
MRANSYRNGTGRGFSVLGNGKNQSRLSTFNTNRGVLANPIFGSGCRWCSKARRRLSNLLA